MIPDLAFSANGWAIDLGLFGSGTEVCFGPSRPDPGRNARDRVGTRTGRDGPHLGTWTWVRNAVKQSTWRIWTGPLRSRDGTWTGPGSDPGEGLDGTSKDSKRPLGFSDLYFAIPCAIEIA